MKCAKCNNEIPENSTFCGVCGAQVDAQENANNVNVNNQFYQNYNQSNNPQFNQSYNQQNNPNQQPYGQPGYQQQPYGQPGYQQPYGGYNSPMPNSGDIPSTGLNILAFLFPMIGLILYLIWKDQYPMKAKAVGKWALIGFVSSFVLGIVMGMISAITMFSVTSSGYLL